MFGEGFLSLVKNKDAFDLIFPRNCLHCGDKFQSNPSYFIFVLIAFGRLSYLSLQAVVLAAFLFTVSLLAQEVVLTVRSLIQPTIWGAQFVALMGL